MIITRNYEVQWITKNIIYQFVSPSTHRVDITERSIKFLKNHFKARLAILDPNYSSAQWDLLIPQINIILNLLRAKRVNQRLSIDIYCFR